MTEPTRDELHAWTLGMLEREDGDLDDYPSNLSQQMYAYAAACVRRVPELEAEVARLRAFERFVAALDAGDITQVIPKTDLRHGYVRVWDRTGECFEGPDTIAAYAAATREGTDAPTLRIHSMSAHKILHGVEHDTPPHPED